MWHPSTWSDLEGLLGEAESPALDFKRKFGSNEELAKDIAAMTVNGGLLIYGVDEDKPTRVATELLPFPIATVEEKLMQVAGTRISPSPDIQVHAIAKPDEPTEGIVAVEIPASSLAPHQANGRFPCRRGTTTDVLEEREVERLYRQRIDLSGPTVTSQVLLEDDFATVLNDFQVEARRTGTLRLVVRPAARDVSHPAGAWQRDALKAAIAASAQRQAHRLANVSVVKTYRALVDWTPIESRGWGATNAWLSEHRTAPTDHQMALIAAALTYPATLSFHLHLGLMVGENMGGLKPYPSARESTVVYETVAALSIAGEYFTDVAGGGQLLAGLSITGFKSARSEFASSTISLPDLNVGHLPPAADGVESSARTSASELRDTPERLARQLIERWLPSFYTDDRDLFDVLVPAGRAEA